jgi:hypothetical protein
MMRELSNLWQSLDDPEYLHLLLEPLPLFGLGIGLIFVIAGLLMAQPQMKLLALIVIVLSCASVQPYVSLRVKSEPRVLAMQDAGYHKLIRDQTQLRSGSAWLYYGIALMCTISLVVTRSGKGFVFLILTLVLCAVGFTHALWLHKKECEVYHRNIVRYRAMK